MVSKNGNIPIRPGISEATLRKAEVCYCSYPEPNSIEIPYRDANDHLTGFKRYRLPQARSNGQKYHQDPGTGVYGYYTPGGLLVLPPKNPFELPAQSMLLVEGEFKALSLYDAGVPVLGLPSFNVYQRNAQNQPQLLPDIETVIKKWAIETIYFLGDSDTTTNFEFARQAAFLVATLGLKLKIFLPRLAITGPKGIDDCREQAGQTFTIFFRELIKEAIKLEHGFSLVEIAWEIFKREAGKFASLSPLEQKRHFTRTLRLCYSAEHAELSPASMGLIESAARTLGLGKREMARAMKAQQANDQVQSGSAHSVRKANYPPEFLLSISMDGEPAEFSTDPNGIVKTARLLEPFWARLYSEKHEIVFVQETNQFKQYNPTTGVWEFVAPSTLQEEISKLIFHYAKKVSILKSLEDQRSVRAMEALRRQLAGKVTRSDPFADKPSVVHLADTMLAWDKDQKRFEKQPFSKDFYSTGRIEVAYKPNAKCPGFDKFLSASLSPDDIDLLQCWFGLVVLGYNPIKNTFQCRNSRPWQISDSGFCQVFGRERQVLTFANPPFGGPF